MKVRKIYFYSKYHRQLKRVDLRLRVAMQKRLNIFYEDCFDPRLKTHKLEGTLKNCYAFYLTYSHRIIFEIIEEGVVGFISIGDHSIYR